MAELSDVANTWEPEENILDQTLIDDLRKAKGTPQTDYERAMQVAKRKREQLAQQKARLEQKSERREAKDRSVGASSAAAASRSKAASIISDDDSDNDSGDAR